MNPLILDEKVISRHGAVVKVKRYVKGWWPELGQLHWGLSGPETVVEVIKVQTMRMFTVVSGLAQNAA